MNGSLKLIEPPAAGSELSQPSLFAVLRREFPHREPREIAGAITTARKRMRPGEGGRALAYLSRGILTGSPRP